MEQQPAAQRAEHAFQTHDEACNGGVHVPLAQDLQGVGHAAGHHAAVGQREPVGPELGQGGVLEQQGGSETKETGLRPPCGESVPPGKWGGRPASQGTADGISIEHHEAQMCNLWKNGAGWR